MAVRGPGRAPPGGLARHARRAVVILDAHPRRHGPAPAVHRLRGIRDGEFELGTETVVAKRERAMLPPRRGWQGPSRRRLDSARDSAMLALAALEILRSDRAMPRGWLALAETLGDRAGAEATVVRGLPERRADLIQIKPNVCYPTPELEALRDTGAQHIALLRQGSISARRDCATSSPPRRKYARSLARAFRCRAGP